MVGELVAAAEYFDIQVTEVLAINYDARILVVAGAPHF